MREEDEIKKQGLPQFSILQNNMPGSDNEDGDEKAVDVGDAGSDAFLRDFRYNIQCQLMANERDLKVRVSVESCRFASQYALR